MSNRKKAKRPWLGVRKGSLQAMMRAEAGPNAIITDKAFEKMGLVSVKVAEEERVFLKEVPAKADGVVIGKALIYDDGSVDVIYDADAPADAIAKVEALQNEMSFGYSSEANE
jgi:hypothetical protein